MLIDWSAIPFVPGMRAGSERQGICADKISAVRVVTKPNAVFDVMVSGMVRLVVDGREFDVHPGDLVFFPAGSRHAAIGVGPEGAVYYEIFAPARPDQFPGWVGSSVLRY